MCCQYSCPGLGSYPNSSLLTANLELWMVKSIKQYCRIRQSSRMPIWDTPIQHNAHNYDYIINKTSTQLIKNIHTADYIISNTGTTFTFNVVTIHDIYSIFATIPTRADIFTLYLLWGYTRLTYVLTWLVEASLVDNPVAESIDVHVLYIIYI